MVCELFYDTLQEPNADFDITTSTGWTDGNLGPQEEIPEDRLREIVPAEYQEHGNFNIVVIANGAYRLGWQKANYDHDDGGVAFVNYRQSLYGDWSSAIPAAYRRNIVLHECFHGFMDPAGENEESGRVEHELGEPSVRDGWLAPAATPSVMATGYAIKYGDTKGDQEPEATCSGDNWEQGGIDTTPVPYVTECTARAILRYTLGPDSCLWWPVNCDWSPGAWDFEYNPGGFF